MEAIIVFLLKAAAGGVVGHYVKNALTKVDKDVGRLFEQGASVAEINATVERKNVSEEVKQVFQEAVQNSEIVSVDLDLAPTPDDKVELFHSVVQLGFKLANEENFDLVLPGSPIRPLSLCIFEKGAMEESIAVHDR